MLFWTYLKIGMITVGGEFSDLLSSIVLPSASFIDPLQDDPAWGVTSSSITTAPFGEGPADYAGLTSMKNNSNGIAPGPMKSVAAALILLITMVSRFMKTSRAAFGLARFTACTNSIRSKSATSRIIMKKTACRAIGFGEYCPMIAVSCGC
jgi:hypothetical protein